MGIELTKVTVSENPLSANLEVMVNGKSKVFSACGNSLPGLFHSIGSHLGIVPNVPQIRTETIVLGDGIQSIATVEVPYLGGIRTGKSYYPGEAEPGETEAAVKAYLAAMLPVARIPNEVNFE